jgi:hypothetical protein
MDYDWLWCMQIDDEPEVWQYDFVYSRENPFKKEWLEIPVDKLKIRKFGVYFMNNEYHVVLIPQQGIFFIDGKKYKWQEFDPSKPTYLVYGRVNRAHIHSGNKQITRDPTEHLIGYRQEGHFVYFRCLGVATSTGTYGRFDYEP